LDTGLLYTSPLCDVVFVTLFAPDYCILRPFFRFYRVVAATHQKIWKAARMVHFYLSVFIH
ncbi:hypothetical protein ACK1PI_004477, partial [Salmonella enterica]